MTGAVGILLGLVAGWTVSGRRRAAMVVVLPFLVVLGIQTWYIASGRASSPPSTVQYPGLFEVIEHWANRDDMTMAQQLGWIPPSPRYLLRMILAKRKARSTAGWRFALNAALPLLGPDGFPRGL